MASSIKKYAFTFTFILFLFLIVIPNKDLGALTKNGFLKEVIDETIKLIDDYSLYAVSSDELFKKTLFYMQAQHFHKLNISEGKSSRTAISCNGSDLSVKRVKRKNISNIFESLRPLLKGCALDDEIRKKIEDDKGYMTFVINSLLKALNDRQTFDTLESIREFTEDHAAIGVILKKEGEEFVIVDSIIGSPAYRAQIRQNVKLVKIDNQPLRGKDLQDVLKILQGAESSHVDVTILKNNWLTHYKLQRAFIKINSVESRMLQNKIGYIRIKSFLDETITELNHAISNLEDKKISGLILDLRGNTGGLLDKVVDSAGIFLDMGQEVYQVYGRDGRPDRIYSNIQRRLKDIKIVILVDQVTSSGAEIFVGALRDWDRATIIGEKTPGVGIIQSLFKLSDIGSVRLNIAYALTPKGHLIDKGIIPDIVLQDNKNMSRIINIGDLSDDQIVQRAAIFLSL